MTFLFPQLFLFQYLVRPSQKYHQLPVSVVNLQMEYDAHDTMMIPVIKKPSYQLYQGPLPPMWNCVWQPPSVRDWVNLTPTGGLCGNPTEMGFFFWDKFGKWHTSMGINWQTGTHSLVWYEAPTVFQMFFFLHKDAETMCSFSHSQMVYLFLIVHLSI